MPEKDIVLKRVFHKYRFGSVKGGFFSRSVFLAFFVLNTAVLVYSQSNVWPSFFETPQKSAPQKDSTSLRVSNKSSLYESFKSRSTVEWIRVEQNYLLEQLAEYTFTDHDYETRNHLADLSGKVLWTGFPFPSDSFGLDWTPITSYLDKDSGGVFYSMVDAGPVLKTNFQGIPIGVKMGLSGYGWNDKIDKGMFRTPILDYQSDLGYYGGLSIGDLSQSVGNIPLYINLNSIGKVVQDNGLGVVMGSALFKHELGSMDSLFLFAGDSLSNGKEIYLRSNVGNRTYSSSPWRIRHSLAGSAGFKAAERFGLLPSLFYSYNLNSVEYPKDTSSFDNFRNSSNTFNAQVQTADWLFLSYIGGIELTRVFEDRIFRIDPQGNFGGPGTPAVFFDYYNDFASSDHELRIDLPRNVAVQYRLNAYKDSKKYVDTTNQNESDYIRIRHHAGLLFDSLSGFSIQPYTEYARSYLYYFRKENSKNSKTKWEYRVGLDATFSRGRFKLGEKLYGGAEITDYKFKPPYAHINDPPPYSRRFTSILTGSCDLGMINLSGLWSQVYHDEGKWYGKAYFDSSDIPEKEYYAIERKSNDYTLQFFVTFLFDSLNVVLGSSFSDVFQREYKYKLDIYEIEDLGRGYLIEPSLKIQYYAGLFSMDGKIGRIINTLDSRKYNLRRNWEIALSLMAEFK